MAYSISMYEKDFLCSEEIIDQVVEWLGRQWKPSMIKRSLREIDPKITLKICMRVIKLARQKIREIYHADPNEFKGQAIEFYASILRSGVSLRYKLTAQQRLDALLGLEHIQTEDPALYAAKILAAMSQMDESVAGPKIIVPDGQQDETPDEQEPQDLPSEEQDLTEEELIELDKDLEQVKWPKGIKVKN